MKSPHLWLALFTKWEILAFLGGLGGILLMRLMTGAIDTRYLLWARRADGSRYFSPERVQLLLSTMAIALEYVMNAAKSKQGEMPALPTGALELLGLSNAIYLGGKGWNLLRRK